jgi:hypothetical protein
MAVFNPIQPGSSLKAWCRPLVNLFTTKKFFVCDSADNLTVDLLNNSPAFPLPRHNSSTQLPAELPDKLLRAPFIWLCRSGVVPPLHSPYDCPYTVVRQGPRSFTIRVGSRDEIVSVSHLKTCTEAEATLAVRNAAADRRASAQAVPPPQSGSHLQTRWFLTFSSGAATRRSRNRFPIRQGGFIHTQDRRRLHSLHRRGTHPVNGYRHRG